LSVSPFKKFFITKKSIDEKTFVSNFFFLNGQFEIEIDLITLEHEKTEIITMDRLKVEKKEAYLQK